MGVQIKKGKKRVCTMHVSLKEWWQIS